MKPYRQIIMLVLLGLQLVSVLPMTGDDICWFVADRACIADPYDGGAGTIRPPLGSYRIISTAAEGGGDAPCGLCVYCLGPFSEASGLAIDPDRNPERFSRIRNRFFYREPALSPTTPPS